MRGLFEGVRPAYLVMPRVLKDLTSDRPRRLSVTCIHVSATFETRNSMMCHVPSLRATYEGTPCVPRYAQRRARQHTTINKMRDSPYCVGYFSHSFTLKPLSSHFLPPKAPVTPLSPEASPKAPKSLRK